MVEDIVQALVEAISRLGPNKAPIPFATDFHDGEWWVYIDINTRKATFEVEAHAPNRLEAHRNALTRFRRELTCAA